MQQILANTKQVLRRGIVVLSLAIFIFTAGFFMVQPSFADTEKPLATEKSFSKVNETPASREAAYEEAVQAVKDPKGLDKEYEKELEVYKEENPGKNPVVEGVKEVVEKVTGKE